MKYSQLVLFLLTTLSLFEGFLLQKTPIVGTPTIGTPVVGTPTVGKPINGTPAVYATIANSSRFTNPNIAAILAQQKIPAICGTQVPSAYQALLPLDNCLYFRRMIERTNITAGGNQLYLNLLLPNTNVTIFCPTNQAIERWCTQNNPQQSIPDCIADPNNSIVVLYNMIVGQFNINDLTQTSGGFQSQTYLLQGPSVNFTRCNNIVNATIKTQTNKTGTFLEGGTGSAKFLNDSSDSTACGTNIHFVSEVVSPCPFDQVAQNNSCGTVWDAISQGLGSQDNQSYYNLIKDSLIYQQMQDVAYRGTFFAPNLAGVKSFIANLQKNGLASTTDLTDPRINSALSQIFTLHFMNYSTIYLNSTSPGQTYLQPGVNHTDSSITGQSMMRDFSLCSSPPNKTATTLMISLPGAGGNASVTSQGYPSIKGILQQADITACSAVVQIIDTVIQPCVVNNTQQGPPVYGATGANVNVQGQSNSGLNSLKNSAINEWSIQNVRIIIFLSFVASLSLGL